MFTLFIILLVSIFPDSTSSAITSTFITSRWPYCNSNVYTTCLRKRENGSQQVESAPAPASPTPPSPPPPRQPTSDFAPSQSRPLPLIIGYGALRRPAPDPTYLDQIQSPAHAPINIYPIQAFPGTIKRSSILQKIVIVIGVLLSIVVFSLIIIFFLKRRGSRHGPNQEFNRNMENFLLNHGSLAPKRHSYSQIKKITNSLNEKLGQGGFGSVYKGVLPDGSLVAVKLLTETNGSGEEFINEVSSISRTSHVNIVNLLGFCYERNKRALVYEFMPNKSLDKFISHCRLDWDTLYKIAVGVARGLEYLHRGCNTRIVHFDIKPQNILLDEDFCPKISDFGLAKLCKKKQSILSVIGTRGTVGYIAPEVFSRNFGRVSHKSDVYSYGMMVLEMAGAKNLAGIGSIQSSENYFPDQVYKHIIPSETMNVDDFVCEVEEEISRQMFLIGFWCIQTIPSDRPSMSKVVEMLEGNLKSIPIPPKPTLFSPRPLEQQLSWSESVNVESTNSIEG